MSTTARILGTALKRLMDVQELPASKLSKSQVYELNKYANRTGAIKKVARGNSQTFTIIKPQVVEHTCRELQA